MTEVALTCSISRYHYNPDEADVDISLLFLVISVAAYYVHRVSSAAAPPVLFYKEVTATSI